jgi:hypothetical protein
MAWGIPKEPFHIGTLPSAAVELFLRTKLLKYFISSVVAIFILSLFFISFYYGLQTLKVSSGYISSPSGVVPIGKPVFSIAKLPCKLPK